MYLLVVVAGAVMIGMLALFYSHQDKGRVYIAVIHYASDAVGDDITRAFGRTKFFVKSKTMRGRPCGDGRGSVLRRQGHDVRRADSCHRGC